MRLTLHPGRFAVVRVDPAQGIPAWFNVAGRGLRGVTTTPDEMSLLVPEDELPEDGVRQVERGFRAFQVAGPLDFSLVGILAQLLVPLQKAGVPVFVVSTFDTDWILVASVRVEVACEAWRADGHQIDESTVAT